MKLNHLVLIFKIFFFFRVVVAFERHPHQRLIYMFTFVISYVKIAFLENIRSSNLYIFLLLREK